MEDAARGTSARDYHGYAAVLQRCGLPGFLFHRIGACGGPQHRCCSFRGSVVALDAATGRTIWQSFTIAEPAKPTGTGSQQGPSGVAIWSTPTIDEQRGALYVGTGNNYSNPVTATSDAVLAFDLKTGKLLWSRQLTQGDAYNGACNSRRRTNCPDHDGPDFDFGQPPILVELGGGKRALVIGQKSGMVHAIDPDAEGKILWQTRAGAGGLLGGSQWGSAADNQACLCRNLGRRYPQRCGRRGAERTPHRARSEDRRRPSCDRLDVWQNRLERQAGHLPRHSGHLLAGAIGGRDRHRGSGVFRRPRRSPARLFQHRWVAWSGTSIRPASSRP